MVDTDLIRSSSIHIDRSLLGPFELGNMTQWFLHAGAQIERQLIWPNYLGLATEEVVLGGAGREVLWDEPPPDVGL